MYYEMMVCSSLLAERASSQLNFVDFHGVFGKEIDRIMGWSLPFRLCPCLGNPGSATAHYFHCRQPQYCAINFSQKVSWLKQIHKKCYSVKIQPKQESIPVGGVLPTQIWCPGGREYLTWHLPGSVLYHVTYPMLILMLPTVNRQMSVKILPFHKRICQR